MKRFQKWLSVVLTVALVISACPLFVYAQEQGWESAFYHDVDGDGDTELLPLKYFGITEIEKNYLYNDNNAYPFSRDDYDFATDAQWQACDDIATNIFETYGYDAYELDATAAREALVAQNGAESETVIAFDNLITQFNTLYETLEQQDIAAQTAFNNDKQKYLAANPRIVLNHTVNPNLTENIKQEETLLYWLHIPYDYNPNKSYPVFVYAHGEDTTNNIIYAKYLNADGTYKSETFNMPTDVNGFMTNWYNLVKEPGENREKYDCFFIYIVNPRELFRAQYSAEAKANSIAIVNQYQDYGADTVNLNSDYTADTSYSATYRNTYDASRLSAASQEQLTVQLIDELMEVYNIDADRQYVMGFSLGGIYTMDIIAHYPDRFACAVPICTASADISEENCKALTRTNIWAISGDGDTTCSKYFSKYLVDGVNEAKEKFGTGTDTVAQYSFFSGGHSGGYVANTNRNAASGVSITENNQVMDFIFNSTRGAKQEACTVDGNTFGSFSAAVEYAGSQRKKTITLLENTDSVDFKSYALTVDLNGHYLYGQSKNAENVTVINSNSRNVRLLSATGIYGSDVSRFVAEGYGAKDSEPAVTVNSTAIRNNQVYYITEKGTYRVVAEATAAVDRSDANEGLDLFTDDYVTVTVKVLGARFVAADVTLTFDETHYELAEYPTETWSQSGASLRFCHALPDGGYYEDGYTLGTFLFRAKAITEAAFDVTFGISPTRAYVASAISDVWNSDSNHAVDASAITDATANIILRYLTAYATPKTGLAYTATEQALLVDDCYVKDNTTGAQIDAYVEYACVSKAQSEASGFSSAALTYGESIPTAVNAGEYVVYYRITKAGYATVINSASVSIAKAKKTVIWSANDFELGRRANKTDNAGNQVEQDFYKAYASSAAALPIAEYDSLETNSLQRATVTVASPSGATLKNVGAYTVRASISNNYEIVNPTCTLLIDGGVISGCTLENTAEGTAVWFDGQYHSVAKVKGSCDSAMNADVTFSLNGVNWGHTIPTVRDIGKYELTMKITADSYYDYTETVSFEIKGAQYRTEKTDYIAGWSLILVYTNDSVPGFEYDGKLMYDVSALGYTYNCVYNAEGNILLEPGTPYTYVFGILTRGEGYATKVTPSNVRALQLGEGAAGRYDVNSSGMVDINDLVAVQAIYNVDSQYFTEALMPILLCADVSCNKRVDTQDCALIKLNSDT